MRIFITVVVATLLFLFAPAARACIAGDVVKGPNCVREMRIEPSEFTAFSTPTYATYVYRMINGFPHQVWRGTGRVTASTAEKIHVVVHVQPKPDQDGKAKPAVSFEYEVLWDGKRYSVR